MEEDGSEPMYPLFCDFLGSVDQNQTTYEEDFFLSPWLRFDRDDDGDDGGEYGCEVESASSMSISPSAERLEEEEEEEEIPEPPVPPPVSYIRSCTTSIPPTEQPPDFLSSSIGTRHHPVPTPTPSLLFSRARRRYLRTSEKDHPSTTSSRECMVMVRKSPPPPVVYYDVKRLPLSANPVLDALLYCAIDGRGVTIKAIHGALVLEATELKDLIRYMSQIIYRWGSGDLDCSMNGWTDREMRYFLGKKIVSLPPKNEGYWTFLIKQGATDEVLERLVQLNAWKERENSVFLPDVRNN